MIRQEFATRLARARAMIARGAEPAPSHIADQLEAARADASVMHDRMGAVLPILEPDRAWRQRLDTSTSDDVRAYLLAALFDCTTLCPHLKQGGPQPAIVKLPLRRADCRRCAATLRRPPPDEHDRCDVCTARGVVVFVPFAIQQGPALMVGDACPECAAVLGISSRQDAAS